MSNENRDDLHQSAAEILADLVNVANQVKEADQRTTVDRLRERLAEAPPDGTASQSGQPTGWWPFFARCVIADETGNEQVYYVCRNEPTPSGTSAYAKVANRRSPIGELAESEPGHAAIVRLPTGRFTPPQERELMLVSRITFSNLRLSGGFDAVEARVAFADRRLQIGSLRRLLLEDLKRIKTNGEQDLVEALMAQLYRGDDAESVENIREGWRRQVLQQMQLRDEALLDRYQGKVVRLPLPTRLFLAGPPGTGKTTTLIKRIAQKLTTQYLSDDEQPATPELSEQLFPPAQPNWVMFTPSDLLKLYLKEAFSGEGIAASESQIRTWQAERQRLGRNVLRLLRSQRGGRLVLDADARYLRDESSPGVHDLHETFRAYLSTQLVTRYREALEMLARAEWPELDRDLQTLRRAFFDPSAALATVTTFVERWVTIAEKYGDWAEREQQQVEEQMLRAIVGVDTNETLQVIAGALRAARANLEPADDGDDNFEREVRLSTGSPTAAEGLAALRAGVRELARRLSLTGEMAKTTRQRWLLDLLGSRTPDRAEFERLGRLLGIRSALQFARRSVANMLEITADYLRFRRDDLHAGRFYLPDANDALARDRVSGAELDVLLLVQLENARSLLLRNRQQWMREDPPHEILRELKSELRTQVLVDEATDFSVVQLRAMAALAHPAYDSFFAAGDVHQRVTVHGIRSYDELRWVRDDIVVQEISTSYRQSRRLRALTTAFVEATSGAEIALHPALGSDDADVPPLLLEGASHSDAVAWLGQRLREIEQTLGLVPSVAIFVDGDERIDPLVAGLETELAEDNLTVVGCHYGRDVGREGEIRVFDVRFIKGLEFEAVFFVGIDEMARREVELFDQFFYLGMTRAATYLGLTCDVALPHRLESIRGHLDLGGWR